LKRQWGEAFSIGEQIRRQFDRRPPQEHTPVPIGGGGTGPTLSQDDVRRLAEDSIQHMLRSMVKIEMTVFAKMSLVVFCANEKVGFITSDAPCVWFDSEAHRRPFPFRHPHLSSRTIEVTLPLSPKRVAVLSWAGSDGYIDSDQRYVDELNRRTRFHADEHFVACRNETRPTWFESVRPTGSPSNGAL